MIFRQLFDTDSSTWTYLLADGATRSAMLIDPVREHVDRDLKLVAEMELTLSYAMDTHVHADHVTGAAMIRARTGRASSAAGELHHAPMFTLARATRCASVRSNFVCSKHRVTPMTA